MQDGKSFTNQILQDVANVFHFFDTDQDGMLSPPEAINVWKKFGLVVNINTLLLDKGLSLDDVISKLESVKVNSDMGAHLHQVFTVLDRANKGYLVAEDFMDYFSDFGEAPEKKFIMELCELISENDSEANEQQAVQESTEETLESQQDQQKLKLTYPEFYEWIKKEQRRKNKKKFAKSYVK